MLFIFFPFVPLIAELLCVYFIHESNFNANVRIQTKAVQEDTYRFELTEFTCNKIIITDEHGIEKLYQYSKKIIPKTLYVFIGFSFYSNDFIVSKICFKLQIFSSIY